MKNRGKNDLKHVSEILNNLATEKERKCREKKRVKAVTLD